MASEINVNFDALINTIPNFDARTENDIEFFVNQFEELASAAKLPENIKLIIIKSKFTGHARQQLMSNENLQKEKEYKKFCDKVKEIFQTESDFAESQAAFSNTKQKPQESVKEFTKRFLQAANKLIKDSKCSDKAGATDFVEMFKLSQYIDNLRSDISFEVAKLAPTTFEEAQKMATNIERAFSNQKQDINVIQSNNSTLYNALLENAEIQNKQIKELTEEINVLKIKKSENNTAAKFCYICKKTSHTTDSCWFNGMRNQQTFVTPRSQNYGIQRQRIPNYSQTYRFQNPPQYYNWQMYPQENYQFNSQSRPNYTNSQPMPVIEYPEDNLETTESNQNNTNRTRTGTYLRNQRPNTYSHVKQNRKWNQGNE